MNEKEKKDFELVLDDSQGITKAYEAVTQYCGFPNPIEAGKTMGLSSHGKSNDKIPIYFQTVAAEDGEQQIKTLLFTYPTMPLL